MLRIDIRDFRCFHQLTLDFKPDVNLLIGDNASGKTSLLMACKYALSSFFAGFSDENTKWESPKSNDFRIVQVNEETLLDELPISITFSLNELFEGASGTYTIEKNSKKNSRPLLRGIADYRDASALLHTSYYSKTILGVAGRYTINKALPLFVSFSTEDIHTVRKISGEQFMNYSQKPSFGYYECMNCNGLLKYWIKRLLVLSEAGQGQTEINVVKKAIVTALGKEGCNIISDMMIRPNRKKVFYRFMDGRESELDMLSDGYKRLVNIVTDIAFRCTLLNKEIYGDSSADRTKGVVLIDEIDMHLHPLLQARVMMGLKAAFPQLQFIVTTHAPMVMTGVMTDDFNAVHKISYYNGEYITEAVNTYGLDASQILRLVLGVSPRDMQVDSRLKVLFDNIDDNKEEEARRELEALENKFHDSLPELAQARAMLDFNVLDND